MKITFFINRRVIPIALAVAGTMALSSCLKDKGPIQDFSQTPALVSIQGDGQYSGIFVATQSVLAVPTPATAVVEVTLSVPSLTLSTPVTATLSVDQATLTAYNAANSDNRTMLPAGDYLIPNNGAVTINPGQQIIKDTLLFYGNKIDFTQNNALALLLTNAKGAQIPTNLNSEVILIKLKSIYEGNYALSGTRTRYNGGTVGSGVAGTSAITGKAFFGTVTPNTIDGQLGDLTSQMSLQVNPDNTVTVLPSISNPGNSFSSVANDGPCTYNPATKTFTLSYKYFNASNNLRHIDEVMVLQ
jgi:hypothetical protein